MLKIPLDNLCTENALSHLNLPRSLKTLTTRRSSLCSVDSYKFPVGLVELNLEENQVDSVNTPNFPTSLNRLYLGQNKITTVHLELNTKGEELQIEILYLNKNKISNFNEIALLVLLKILNCDSNPLGEAKEFYILPEMEEISLKESNLSSSGQASNAVDSKLKFINLSGNALTDFITPFTFEFPLSIRWINMARNRLFSVPSQICKLPNVQVLNMSNNFMELVDIDFLTGNLEVLNLSDNKIRSLKLSFSENSTTHLKALYLLRNGLRNFTIEDIGHNLEKNTGHDNLYELELSMNQMTEEGIKMLKQKLPPAVKCL